MVNSLFFNKELFDSNSTNGRMGIYLNGSGFFFAWDLSV
ncbi:hypothetical protein P872_04090 [Rhodonellum psychrophilum GCM71 = DSM 17998]|uniref:Uncharacterized protein n=1 Tax=Rhodonellum psychrophilum GCM71 = DSM 17998 TaxID=1123057 RepID=U5BYQ3_9BACT|nr:hypothetical protein P872_04090 [Rhodonellum psychrophilum GCM71 = DSM 17998]